MTVYLLRRLAGLVPLFVGITFVSFLVIRLAPGGPVGAAGAMNPKLTAQAREKMQALYGLDRPLLIQYASWSRRVACFDFGRSFADGEAVTAKIARAVPVTLGINLLSLLLIFALGVPLGVYSAVKKGTHADRALTTATMAAFSAPTFWLALLLMSLFGVHWRLLPVSGIASFVSEDFTPLERAADTARHLVLPVFVSALTGLAGISRFMRASLLQTLGQPYVRAARAKGLPEKKVLYGHAVRNALLPTVTLLGLSVPGLLGGSVVFETVFSIPGMGRLFFQSVFTRDYPVIMGILVLGAVLTLLGNLAADIAYHFLDPRIRVKSEGVR